MLKLILPIILTLMKKLQIIQIMMTIMKYIMVTM